MFDLRERFEYLRCGVCGLLQIAQIPDDLARFYGDGYYSLQKLREKKLSPLAAQLRTYRTRFYLGEKTMIGRLLAQFGRIPQHFAWLTPFNLTLKSSILDVGCGTGGVLLKLRREGFSDLLGLDPFLPTSLEYASGVTILAEPIEAVKRSFDLIMLHHSLEHMPDQHGIMQALRARLNPHGGVLLRLPVAESYAHRRYGIHWMAWDAPRHLYLHTVRSLHYLAKLHGFEIFDIRYDARPENLLGCEYYQRDIAHKDWPETQSGGKRSLFSPETLHAMRQLTQRLNATLDGDTACFYLRVQ
ncbi:MAG: class I SAM-dependent methyltransferase [Magnetococcales bacterium]|nr:class I SAM-dependent methyltransferase [Magnetococcales bacterium]